MNEISKVINKKNKSIPIWCMRQAGRYMSEYQAVRKDTGSFLDLCYNPKKAAEVTLQPISRFDFSGAIIFSDILVLPHALGWSVKFEENIGPVLGQFKSAEDFRYLEGKDIGYLQKVYEAISIVRKTLASDKFLIGFAGSPWTVASYMLEGKSKKDFSASKKFLYQERELAISLINLLTEHTISHLIGQIKAGCNVIQLFDSWSGMLSGIEYEEFIIKPTKKIVDSIKEQYSDIPVIGFPKGSGFWYEKYIDITGIDVVGVDQFVPIAKMREWQEKIVIQGNLDPVILLTNKQLIKKAVDDILLNIDHQNYIFNLGHGILPTTPVENVEFLVNYVKEFKQ